MDKNKQIENFDLGKQDPFTIKAIKTLREEDRKDKKAFIGNIIAIIIIILFVFVIVYFLLNNPNNISFLKYFLKQLHL